MGKKSKKSIAVRKIKARQQGLQEESYKKAPHSFVFNRGHVGKNIQQLIRDVRHVMEPYTASSLKTRRKNVLKDFVSVAGVLNVTHFLTFTKTEICTNMKVMRLPHGPTLTFKVHNYCLSKDVISSLKKPNLEQKQFQYHPLLVMNNFNSDQIHLKLMSSMFQNMFPSINVNKVDLNEIRRCILMNYEQETNLIDFRHYNIKVVPVGMSRGVKKLIKADIPDLSRYHDISEFMAQGGNVSESEGEQDGEHNEVVLPQSISSRGNVKSTKSAIRLTELGPRLKLELVKIEEGLCQGQVMFHQYIEKSTEELEKLSKIRQNKRKLKELRKKKQKDNVEKKAADKEENKQKSLAGMKRKAQELLGEMDGEDITEADYFRQEVGEEPDQDMFSEGRKKKTPSSRDKDSMKKQHKNNDKHSLKTEISRSPKKKRKNKPV